MIEPERRDNVKVADADKVLHEERLVIGRAILFERDSRGSRAARRVKIRNGVTSERRFAVINHAAESERAAFEHRVIAPLLSETQIESAVIEFFVAESGARWRVCRHQGGRRAEVA